MKKMFFAICSWLLVAGMAGAQEREDVVSVTDSVSNEIETLVEQSTGNENSPLLDDLDDRSGPRREGVTIRSRFMEQLQQSRGYAEQKYLGSQLKSYQQMKLSRGEHVSAALILEKDAGERRFDDFAAGYLRFSSFGPIASIIVGDYLVESGQGIALWRGYEALKGANVVAPVKRSGRELVPYASADENSFLRGGAVNVALPGTSMTVFYSKKSYSGTVDASDNVTGLYTSGYFRTDEELAKQNAFREELVGARLRYNHSEVSSIGLTGYTAAFSRFLNFGTTFRGSRAGMLSADYDFRLADSHFFGEWAIANGSDPAGVSGMMISPFPELDLISQYRSYPPDFFSLHGNGFGDQAGTTNERGLYVGLRLTPASHVTITSYFDQFQCPFPKATLLYPSAGNDFLVQCAFSPFRRFHVEVRYSRKAGESAQVIPDGEGRSTRADDRTLKTAIRVNGDYRFSPDVNFRARVEDVDFETQLSGRRETGMMMYQDVALHCFQGLMADLRIVWFGTDSYDAGIGEYETDLPGQLSVPVLYGHGVRWYLVAGYSLSEECAVSLKYSNVIREDVRNIGSGLDELPTDHDNRIGFQMDVRF